MKTTIIERVEDIVLTIAALVGMILYGFIVLATICAIIAGIILLFTVVFASHGILGIFSLLGIGFLCFVVGYIVHLNTQ